MSGTVQKVVLLPRFTTFVGAGDFLTAPVNVRQFAQGLISVWRGRESVVPGLDDFTVTLQESPDLEIWNDVASLVPDANEELSATADFDLEWVRLKINLSLDGSPAQEPSVTCWAVANLVPRESPEG